jgi:hypothetical protein
LYAFVYGSEPLAVQWFKDQRPIPDAVTPFFNLPAVEFSDSGDYFCVVSNPAGSATSAVARVTVVGLRVANGPYANNTLLSNYTTLVVNVESSVRVFYQWFFEGTPVPGATNLTLELPALNPTYAGNYFVTVSNTYTALTSQVAVVTVSTQAPLAYASINNLNGTARVYAGESVKFTASAVGGPPPTLQWLRDGVPIPGWTSNFIIIPKARLADSGMYSVLAESPLGSATSQVVGLEVTESAPVFAVVPNLTNQVEGSIVTMRALALGGPPPGYQWRHNGSVLPGATNSVLVLPNARLEDAGVYEASARNDLGEARVSATLEIRPRTGLDRWDWSLPHPQGNRLNSVVWGNGRYAAVGKSGNIITSTDGLNWSNVLVEADCDLYAVSYGNGRFVASGSILSPSIILTNAWNSSFYPTDRTGIVLTSPDGITWTAGQAPEGDWLTEIAFGSGRFIAAGAYRGAFLYTSEDGAHWTPILIPDRMVSHVVYGKGLFLASTGDRVYSSANGLDWKVALTRAYVYFDWLATSEDGFTAMSGMGSIYTSPDAQTWTERGIVGRSVRRLVMGGGRWIGIPSDPVGSLIVSEDGYAWSLVDTGTRQQIESMIYAEGGFLAVGEAGTITTSTDGFDLDAESGGQSRRLLRDRARWFSGGRSRR